MADVTKIKLPDNSEYNLKDHRIPGVDTTPTSGSDNVVTSGGIYDAMTQNEYVVAAAINDLNDRLLDVEDSVENTTIPTKISDLENDSGFTSNTGTLTGVSFNGVDATVTNGVANIAPYHIDLNGKYLYITLSGSCVLQIVTTYHGQYENGSVTHLINVDVDNDIISVNPICLGGSGITCFELYSFMYQNGEFKPVGIRDRRSSGGDLILTMRIYNDEEDSNATKSADITVLGGIPPLSYTISNTIIQEQDYRWKILSSSITNLYYSNGVLFETSSDGSGSQVFTASSIVSEGGGLTGVSFNGSPATVSNGVASITANIPAAVTESTVSGWGFTKNAAPGTLVTNATTAQTASSGEAMSGTITLHKIAKTGTYSDLIGTPTIPTVPTNVSSFTNDANYVKYVLCNNEAAYNAISNKDSGTLYLIPKT